MPRTLDARESDVVLRDGSTLHLRAIRPGDAAAIRDLYAHLSPEGLHHRFGEPHLPGAAEVDRLCRADGRDSVALVAERATRIVAVVHYFRSLRNIEHAEVTFAVADDFQGRGVGTRMLEQLADVARAQGITTFNAEVLGTNHPMLQVFEDSGFDLHEDLAAGVTRVRLSLTDTPAREERSATRSQTAAAASMRAFFEPRTVAVVGVNRERGRIGSEIFHNLIAEGFSGHLFPVSPKLTSTGSMPAYGSVRQIPFDVDLAVIAVPADHVASVVDDCIAKGVRAIVVISAGFGETDAAGRAREAALLTKVRAAGIRMIGPNCMGLLNTDPAVRLNATFAPGVPPPGRIALSSQSGALGLAILDYLRHLNLGISTFVSVGNKADVSSNDLLQYWADDPHTDVILLYLESFGNPRKFSQLARRIGHHKPIVAVKAGRSGAGARAASSHTGALAATDTAVHALFKQSGVIRTDTLEEMFDVAMLLAHQPLPAGPRVAVLTNAGGPGILATDACEAHALAVPALSAGTVSALRQFLPNAASVANPVDMLATASAGDYRRAIPLLLADPGVDSLLIIFTPPLVTEAADVANAIVDAARGAGKPVLATFMAAKGAPKALAPIPCYTFPESAARALARVAEYVRWQNTPIGSVPAFPDTRPEDARAIVERALARGPEWLDTLEAHAVLDAFGIPVIRTLPATTEDEAISHATSLGFPVVLKAAGPTIVHKTEARGVALNLRNESAVRIAYRDFVTRFGSALAHVLVQPMVAGGVEILAGAALDPSLGHVVLCGSGGTLTELVRDSVCRLHPLTDLDAASMLNEMRGVALLRDFRGTAPLDESALRELLLRISALLEACPEIREMDINPVMVLSRGVCAVDVRIRVESEPIHPPSRHVVY